ncbi:hypothetical protein GOBAR_DD32473 [Gossypium barbadense]|nr:hypothetical protein GOBAR_DD32473 [Gossypium barbadense]
MSEFDHKVWVLSYSTFMPPALTSKAHEACRPLDKPKILPHLLFPKRCNQALLEERITTQALAGKRLVQLFCNQGLLLSTGLYSLIL